MDTLLCKSTSRNLNNSTQTDKKTENLSITAQQFNHTTVPLSCGLRWPITVGYRVNKCQIYQSIRSIHGETVRLFKQESSRSYVILRKKSCTKSSFRNNMQKNDYNVILIIHEVPSFWYKVCLASNQHFLTL